MPNNRLKNGTKNSYSQQEDCNLIGHIPAFGTLYWKLPPDFHSHQNTASRAQSESPCGGVPFNFDEVYAVEWITFLGMHITRLANAPTTFRERQTRLPKYSAEQHENYCTDQKHLEPRDTSSLVVARM